MEARLRQVGIVSIEDVEWATLEVSGQLGYNLKSDKQPATKSDIQYVLSRLDEIENSLSTIPNKDEVTFSNIFSEIKSNKFEGNKLEPN
ncbi:YetF domain-containing protein [Risungbinella massiliensis]|uniref:YetF domain-containing protein n=1 Tax=Risungbinella massiliensis TaxID=1329796 RepID=UPI002D781FB1|nr:YetF domain-containing protein [Risungbinella massiliensis]